MVAVSATDTATAAIARTIGVPALTPLSWLGLTFLVLAPFLVVGQETASFLRKDSSRYKGFSGVRVRPDSTRQIYFHDQTIAVVELGPGRELYACELIEVNYPQIAKAALQNLTFISKPILISFQDMKILMNQCHNLPSGQPSPDNMEHGRGKESVNPLTILSGILPGTKWCGTGDIAKTYYDLGSNTELDKCCRSHDLCPVKVRAFESRYNLTNFSIYTKSHCDCDNMLYFCLKSAKNPTADILGNLYFNVIKVPCVDDIYGPTCKGSDCVDRSSPGSQTPKKRRFRTQILRY
ncbi:group 3 secretory phospholipase A2 [Anabrus simplex]|uniref:group 3 secretory phospholipase A2 n=1 Tax=Anabrus simplex TaxID=316456 RepID=UPI0035A32EB1